MINLMNMRVIKDKLSEEAAVIVANDRVYWKCYSEDCIEEIQESPIEWLNQPWGVDRMSIAIYANSCSKGFSVTIGGDGNVVAIHGHKKIRVIITGMENFVESEDENALISVVEDYNYHNYAHGKFLKKICGVLYDIDTSRYQLRISDNQMCQIIVADAYRAGIWDCWNESIVDQGDCQVHYLDDWFPITEKFSHKSNKSF